MTKAEEIEAAYRERDEQDRQRLEQLRLEYERKEQEEYLRELAEEEYREYMSDLHEEESSEESLEEDYEEDANFYEMDEPEDETPPLRRSSCIDYESLVMSALMGGYGDAFGYD